MTAALSTVAQQFLVGLAQQSGEPTDRSCRDIILIVPYFISLAASTPPKTTRSQRLGSPRRIRLNPGLHKTTRGLAEKHQSRAQFAMAAGWAAEI